MAILGATGAVGQRFVHLLTDHPWFETAALAASERSAGHPYADACNWVIPGDPPPSVTSRTFRCSSRRSTPTTRRSSSGSRRSADGRVVDGRRVEANVIVSAQANCVPVLDGHTICLTFFDSPQRAPRTLRKGGAYPTTKERREPWTWA